MVRALPGSPTTRLQTLSSALGGQRSPFHEPDSRGRTAGAEGIKHTLSLIETTAPLPAEARREHESLMAAAFRSEASSEARPAFMKKRAPHFLGR